MTCCFFYHPPKKSARRACCCLLCVLPPFLASALSSLHPPSGVTTVWINLCYRWKLLMFPRFLTKWWKAYSFPNQRKSYHSCPQFSMLSVTSRFPMNTTKSSFLSLVALPLPWYSSCCWPPFFSCDACCFFWLYGFMQFRDGYCFMASFELLHLLFHCSLLAPAAYVRSFMNESSSCPISDYTEPLWEPFNWAWYSPSIFSYSWPEKPFTSDTSPPISFPAGAIIFLPFSWFLYCPFRTSLFFRTWNPLSFSLQAFLH